MNMERSRPLRAPSSERTKSCGQTWFNVFNPATPRSLPAQYTPGNTPTSLYSTPRIVQLQFRRSLQPERESRENFRFRAAFKRDIHHVREATLRQASLFGYSVHSTDYSLTFRKIRKSYGSRYLVACKPSRIYPRTASRKRTSNPQDLVAPQLESTYRSPKCHLPFVSRRYWRLYATQHLFAMQFQTVCSFRPLDQNIR